MAKKSPTPKMTIQEYLKSCGGMETYIFDKHEKIADNHQDAYNFAHTVRKNEPDIIVELNLTTVRLFLEKKKEIVPNNFEELQQCSCQH
jgi:hypothetical protein